MLSLITRFLPGLGSVLPSFLSPWVLVAILAASSGCFLYGLHIGDSRLQTYQAAVKAQDDARKTIVRYVTVQQKVIDEETTNALQLKNDQLTRDNAALMRSLQQYIKAIGFRTDVPTTPCGGESGDGICVSKSKLVDGLRTELQSFVDRSQPSIERGDRTRNLLEACYNFTEKQHALTSGQ